MYNNNLEARVTGTAVTQAETVASVMLRHRPANKGELSQALGFNMPKYALMESYLREIATAVATQSYALISTVLKQHSITMEEYEQMLDVPLFGELVTEAVAAAHKLGPAERNRLVAALLLPGMLQELSGMMKLHSVSADAKVRATNAMVEAAGLKQNKSSGGGRSTIQISIDNSYPMSGAGEHKTGTVIEYDEGGFGDD